MTIGGLDRNAQQETERIHNDVALWLTTVYGTKPTCLYVRYLVAIR